MVVLQAWCALNSRGVILNLHDICHNSRFSCPKQSTFTLRQIQLEGIGFRHILHRFSEGTQTTWNNIFDPALNIASPYIEKAVSAKTKNPKSGETTSITLK